VIRVRALKYAYVTPRVELLELRDFWRFCESKLKLGPGIKSCEYKYNCDTYKDFAVGIS
jgi:hypothetical protein